jgi:uncharacterized protein (TIGR02145 family)
MKKITVLTGILMIVFSLTAQERKMFHHIQNGNVVKIIPVSHIDSITFPEFTAPNMPEGIRIGDVVWATNNVDVPGTFAANPYDAGMFYQWNRSIGWSSANPMINSAGGANWDGTTPAGDSWTGANNVCPAGWRLPTQSELQSLVNSGTTWGNLHGVSGRFFGNSYQRLFLPAGGNRGYSNGVLGSVGNNGFYWSSTPENNENAYALGFYKDGTYLNGTHRGLGVFVRCVKE